MNYEYNELIKRVHPEWLSFFENNRAELENILNLVNADLLNGKTIYPYPQNVFRTLYYFGPKDIKLVLLGQDPYINAEIYDDQTIPQACGMSFGVPKIHKKIPPSLSNIFTEIKNCYPDSKIPKHGFLKRWICKEKMLLLNSALTVIAGKSNSHKDLWSSFTDKLIEFISRENKNTIFLLMGNFAINKSNLIDINKHKIFTTVHPSPLSASKGFFGCKVFIKIDEYLKSKNKKSIKWLKNK